MSGAPFDPGLQAERTALAWKRTGLAMAVNALLVLRSGLAGHPLLLWSGAALALAAGGLMLTAGHRRARLLQQPPQAAPPALMLATAVLGAAAAGLSCWAILSPP